MSQARETKAKINRCYSIKLKNVCRVKKPINKIKRLLTEWERIFENDMTNKMVNMQNIQRMYTIQHQKTNKLYLKMGRKSEYNFFFQKTWSTGIQEDVQILLSIRKTKITRNPYILWECKFVVPLWNTVRRSLRN